jgi:hypothetical protein
VERWARLTWQAGDPPAVATLLGERLGVTPEPSRRAAGSWDLWLGAELLEVVPWRREQPGDEPAGEGRLVFEPVFPGDRPAGDTPDDRGPAGAGQAAALVAVIWATVDLERAEADLAPWLEPLEPPAPPDGRDGIAGLHDEPHLGARGRIRTTSGLPGGRLVLLEPTTEGALAASLARDGEGPCGLYIRGVPTGRLRRLAGPFGPSVRLRTASRSGPHLLLLAPGTITP